MVVQRPARVVHVFAVWTVELGAADALVDRAHVLVEPGLSLEGLPAVLTGHVVRVEFEQALLAHVHLHVVLERALVRRPVAALLTLEPLSSPEN